ncbi:MAG: tetratricopeptide repeat protein [Bacteroidetes bacterium]|nr:tetratricopeptide repeat protein [Bacteroidota bacterium]
MTLAVCLSLVPHASLAQSEGIQTDVVRELMMYRVYYTMEQDGYHFVFLYEDPWPGTRSPFTGLFEGSKGAAKSVYKNAGRDDGAADHLGSATVYAVTDSMVTVHVELTDTTRADLLVYEGDVVELATDIPDLEERSVFFELVKLSIRFLDADREPLFGREAVLYEDGPALRDSLLQSMLRTVHATADMIRPQITPGSDWDIPIEKGRFGGFSMVDAMTNSDAEDVWNFLRFVASYPGKYLGQDWRIDETYATWLINDAPPGQEELRDLLVNAWQTPAFDSLLTVFGSDLDDGIFTTEWANEAEALGDEGAYDDAFRLLDIVADIAEFLDDRDMYAFMLFSRADVMSSMEDYEASVSMYQEARTIFQESGNLYGESIAVNNLGNALDDLERYEEAIETFTASIELKNQRLEADPTLDLRTSQAASWYGLGAALDKVSRFEEAIVAFREADTLYQSEGSLQSQRYHLQTLNQIGKVLRKLGRSDEALATFQQSRETARLLGDVEGEADALDEIGFDIDNDEAALAIYQEAYRLHMQSGSIRDAGYSQSALGQTLWRLKRLDEAIEAHRLAISLREEAGFISGQAYSWTKLGGLYKDAGDPVRAIEAYDKAAGLYEQVDNRSGSADVLEDLGDLFIQEKDFLRAVETHSRALANGMVTQLVITQVPYVHVWEPGN